MSYTKEKILTKLANLPPQLFVKLFRKFLDKQQYPYPDESLLEEQYEAALVLLADVPIELIEEELKNVDKEV